MIPAYIAAWKMKKEKNDMPSGQRYQDEGPPSGYILNPNRRYAGGRGATPPPKYIKGPLPPGYHWQQGMSHDSGQEQAVKMKGGGGGGPPPPTPQEEAEAQLFLQRERDKDQKKKDDAAALIKKQEQDALRTKATGIQNTAYSNAQSFGSNQLANRGYNAGLLDKYNVYDQYMADINTQKGGLDEFDITPDYNTNNALMNAINTGQTTYRGDVTKGINAFTGSGFENQLIGDTMDDAILNTILGGQNTKAKDAIEAARARGLLNDTGYANALKELSTANTAGMGQLQSIGGGVLGGYRTGLTNAKNQALTTAGGLTLADLYDMNAYQAGITGQVNKAKSGLSGDIYNAVGDQQFFDPNKIIAGAGAGQGFYNPAQTAAPEGQSAQPLMDLLTEEEKRRTSPTSQVF